MHKKSGTFLTSNTFGFGNLSLRRGLAMLLAYLLLLQPVVALAQEMQPPPPPEPIRFVTAQRAAAPAVDAETAVVLRQLSTAFNDHGAVRHHPPSNALLATAGGKLELIDAAGVHRPFSNFTGVAADAELAVAKDGAVFLSSAPATIVRISPDGATVQTPWASLIGDTGTVSGLAFDAAGDLFAVTTTGGLWRITPAAVATRVATLPEPLGSVVAVPVDADRYGPLSGTILAGAKATETLYVVNAAGVSAPQALGLVANDLAIVPPHANFYGVDSAADKLLGAPEGAFAGFVGDILVAQGTPGTLARLRWNGTNVEATQIASATRWDSIAFSPAGIAEVPPVRRVYEAIAVTRHAPVINSGRIEGTLWQLLPESVLLDGTDVITSDLLIPGTPGVTAAPTASFGGVIQGSDAATPTTHSVTISSNAKLRHLVNRTAAFTPVAVLPPPATTGTRDVSLTKETDSAGDFATIRNLSISGKAGDVTVPPGTYGTFSAAGRTAFTFGVAGSTQPSVYNFDSLSFAGGSELHVAGPAVITVKTGASLAGSTLGASDKPSQLVLRVAAGGTVDVGGNAILYAVVRAPEANVVIHGGGRLRGTVTADTLRVDGNGVLEVTENDVPPPPINRPPSVVAGANQTTTLPSDTIQLEGTVSDDGLPTGTTLSVQWTKVSGPGTVTFSSATSAATSATFGAAGTYVLRLAASDSLLSTSDTLTVTVIPKNQAPVADAGPDQTIELPAQAILQGSWTDDGLPSTQTVGSLWTRLSGPGQVMFDDVSSPTTTATFSAAGTYTLQLAVNDGELTARDTVVITVIAQNQKPVVDAGPDQTIVLPNVATLAGTATDDGLPAGSTLTQAWTQVSGPGVATFASVTTPATTVSFTLPGTYVLRLTANDTRETVSDDVTITVDPANTAPVVSAGPDRTIELPAVATLAGSVTDDGWPRGSTVTQQWSVVDGSGVTFAAPTAAATTASFATHGTYTLRLTATDGDKTVSDDTVITVQPQNAAPEVNAGADQTIVLPSTAALTGTATDDGWPAGSTLATTWSKVSGPGGVTFASATSAITSASFSLHGVYVLRLTATDGRETVNDDVTITVDPVNAAPVVKAGADLIVELPNAATLAGSVTDDGWPRDSTVAQQWSFVSGPGSVTFADATAAATTATFSAAGTYVLKLTATDGELSASDDVVVTVHPLNTAPVVNAGLDQQLRLPATATLAGTATDDGLPLGSTLVATWSQVSGAGNVTFGNASALTTTAAFSAAGTYVLRLTVTDGRETASDELTLVVAPANEAPVVSAGADQSGVLAANLVANGGGENEALTPWTGSGGLQRITGNAPEGEAFLLASAPLEATQDVALPPGATQLEFRSFIRGAGRVTFEFRDAAGSVLDSLDFTAGTGNGWTALDESPGIPAGTVSIRVRLVATGEAAFDGITVRALDVTSLTLAGTATDDGLVAPLTTQWTRVSGPAAVVFGDATKLATTVTFTQAGVYVLRLTATDGELTVSDDVTITIGAANLPPVVDAGPAQTIRLPQTATLAGVATDDGTLTLAWSAASGPGAVTFSNAAIATPVATFSVAGTYVLRLTATDGEHTIRDEVTIVVQPANSAPAVSAGADQSIVLPDGATLAGVATDPENQTLTLQWSVVSGTGVTFANANSAATTATFAADGTYVLRLTANDGELSASDDVTIVVSPEPVNQQPAVSAGIDQTIEFGQTVTLSGTATDDKLPRGSTLAVQWSGPAGVTFADATSATTTATFSAAGTYVLELTATDSLLTASDEVTITVLRGLTARFTVPGDAHNATPFDNNLANLGEGARLVAVSSTLQSAYAPERALDDNSATEWKSAQPTNQFLIIRLAGNRVRTFDRIRIGTMRGSEGLRNFRVDVSTTTTDEAAFRTILTETATETERVQEFLLPAPVEARYVRLFAIDSRGSSTVTVRTFDVIASEPSGIPSYLTPAGITLPADGGSVYQTSSGNGASAIDGNVATFWQAAKGNNPFTRIVFAQTYLVDRIRLTNYDVQNQGVKDLHIEITSGDGITSTFTTVLQTVAANHGNVQEFIFPNGPVKVRLAKVTLLSNHGHANYSSIREIEFVPVPQAIASVSSVLEYHRPEGLLDNNVDTSWQSAPGRIAGEYVIIRLNDAEPRLLQAVAMYNNAFVGVNGLKDFDVLLSTTTDEPSAFVPVLSATMLNNAKGQYFLFPGGPRRARYLKLVARSNYGGDRVWLQTFWPHTAGSDGNVISMPGTVIPVRELSPALIAGGAKVVAASSGNPADMLDYAHSNPWTTAGTANQFAIIELGGGVPHILTGAVVAPRLDTATPTSLQVRNFEIWLSSTTTDAAAFTKVATGTVTASDFVRLSFPPTAARYVKYVPLNSGSTSAIATGYFDVITQEPYGGVIAASGRSGTQLPQMAFDTAGNTLWTTPSSTNQWVKVALPGGRTRKIYAVRIEPANSGSAPKDFEVRVSTTTAEDGAFTTVYSGTAAQVGRPYYFTPVDAKYVQLYFRNGYGTTMSVYDLQVWTVPEDGAAIYQQPSMTDVNATANGIIDANPRQTVWAAPAGTVTNQTLGLILPDAKEWVIDHVMLQPWVDCCPDRSVRDFEVQVSTTDTAENAWTTVLAATLRPDNTGQHFYFPAAKARFVRLRMLDNWGGAQLALQNFWVYSPQVGSVNARFLDATEGAGAAIASWHWDFGDGTTSSERDPAHQYAAPGVYNVRLTVTDLAGRTSSYELPYRADGPPVVNFNFTPNPGAEASTLNFSSVGSSSNFGALTNYRWIWGDGEETYDHTGPSKQYGDNGNFNVTLLVTNARGVSASMTKLVPVLNLPPTITAGADRTVQWGDDWGIQSHATDASVADRNTIVCRWDFGDGNTRDVPGCYIDYLNARQPAYAYTTPGVYDAKLTVTDKDGGVSTDIARITVTRRAAGVRYTGLREVAPNQPLLLQAKLLDQARNTPLAGRTIVFNLDGQLASAVTDANGVAQVSVTYAGTTERPNITATFEGEALYSPSTITVAANCAADPTPLDIVLLFDSSGSMSTPLPQSKAAALDFLSKVRANDQVSIADFADNGLIQAPLTLDRQIVANAINALAIRGGTQQHYGVDVATAELTGPRHRPGARMVMVILGDGDTWYQPAIEAANRAKAAGIRIITVALNNSVGGMEVMRASASSYADFYIAAKYEEMAGIYGSLNGTLCAPANQPPSVYAGPAQTLVLPQTTVTLDGTATDDGLPAGSTLTTTWSKTSGPGTVTFANASAIDTTATLGTPGTYVLTLTASDTAITRTSDITIKLLPPNVAPVVDAGPDQSVTLPSVSTTQPFALKVISTEFRAPIGIDYHAPSNKVVLSANYPSGTPHNFELVGADGSHSPFSNVSGLTDELKVATARDDGNGMSRGGFPAGTLFAGTGVAGVIMRISPDGSNVQNPWVTLPGENGLMRGSLYVDRTGVFGGDLIAVTTTGGVWRITSAGVPTKIASVGTHLEGAITIPNEARYGPWAGRIVAGAEATGVFWAVDVQGNKQSISLGILPEDLDLIPANENFFGVDYGGGKLWGAPASMFAGMAGDILVAEEHAGILWRVRWNGSAFEKQELARVTQWEHVTFAPAGIAEVPQATPVSVTLTGTVTDDGQPPSGTQSVTWSSVSGPATVTFNSVNALTTVATVTEPGTYVLRLAVSDSELTGSDTMTLTVNPANVAPRVNAGADKTATLRGSTLSGSVTDEGTVTSTWSKVTGPGTVTFADASSLTTGVTFSAFGAYTLRLTANDGEFTRSDDVVITVEKTAGNVAPSVSAGADVQIIDPVTVATLNGSATDDGIPSAATLTYLWTKVSGPGEVTFANAAASSTTATFSAYGDYVLRLTADDSELNASDDVGVKVRKTADNAPPAVNAGADATILTNSTTLNGTATDDGLPTGSSVTVAWSKVSGPGNVTFGNATALSTAVTFSTYGSYVLRLTATDGELPSTDDVTINYEGTNTAPAINAGADRIAIPNTAITLTATVTDDNLPIGSSVAVTWTKASGPGTVTFGTPNANSTTATFTDLGTYVLRATATDGALMASDEVTVTVQSTLPAPVVELTAPVDGTQITTVTPIVGTISEGTEWRVEYRLKGTTDPYTEIASGVTPVTDGTIAIVDPTMLPNGLYEVRVVATDPLDRTASARIDAVVTGEHKAGKYTMSFIDLTVPVAGLPIQLVRNYDSRVKRSGDFGFGWSLALRNVRLQESRAAGDSWDGNVQTTGGIFPTTTYCLLPMRAHVVTVTISDTQVYEFDAVLDPSSGCQKFTPLQEVTVSFKPRPGTNATLEAVGDTSAIVEGSWPGPMRLLDFGTGDPIDFDQYRLTLADGSVMTIDQAAGVKEMVELNGEKLTISAAGVVHSSGKSVTFHRDAAGRIERITDPAGESMTYTYDAGGDLIRFTDRDANTTAFGYDTRHNITSIDDPRGVRAVRHEYDDAGRLIKQIDAKGKEVVYSYDINTRVDVVTDRMGKATVYEYDEWGRQVKVTDAEGRVSRRTWDSRGNMTSETKPGNVTSVFTYDANNNLESSTDPAGNKRSYTYNGLRQVLTMTEPGNRIATMKYDPRGNVLEVKDPAGNLETFTYDTKGRKLTHVDRANRLTKFEYEPATGYVTKLTDPTGTVTTFGYDANGNRTTEAVTRTLPDGSTQTLTTITEYDKSGHLTKVTKPDNTFTETTYNALGQPNVHFDELRRRTVYEYDEMGRPMRTTYPDGTKEETTYDGAGRRLKYLDRTGELTTFEYDDTGLLTKTLHSDGTFTSTQYDAAGRPEVETNERGYSSRYEYDTFGRRWKTIDPLGRATVTTYDAFGNVHTVTDPKANVTTYEYDHDQRLTRTIYPDLSDSITTYDGAGRKIRHEDQNDRVTRWEYDGRDRLKKVIDALGQETTYTYDEVGNLLTETDVLQRTTRYEYDQRGRRIKRTLPGGMSESYRYDVVGNMIERTDFNGRKTTYTYDDINRVRTKVPDPVFAAPTVSYTYYPWGPRQSMTDASGTTTYTYGPRGRLKSKATPRGTLTYAYDKAGNLEKLTSSNTNGVNVEYGRDELGRLATVKDLTAGETVATYAYDRNSNVESVSLANGVTTTYGYDQLDRVMTIGAATAAGSLAGYTYTREKSGHVLTSTDASGRRSTYVYDALYRLRSETISGDAVTANNGVVGYDLDAVGNRKARTSTVAGIPTSSATYDANDRSETDTFDLNGNTTASLGTSYVYDFENRIVSVDNGRVTFVYDGDGNRVSMTVGGVTTEYLVDDRNPTRYAQVVEERVGGTVQRVFTWGRGLLTQRRLDQGSWKTSYYGNDAHGSVRMLTDESGAVTDTYVYDAFGILLQRTGTTPNDYLYAGEHFDAPTGLYYLRARYYRPQTGTFFTADTYEGDVAKPQSRHKYLYTEADPVNNVDPSGHMLVAIWSDLRTRAELVSIQYARYGQIVQFVLEAAAPLEVTMAMPGLTLGAGTTVTAGAAATMLFHADTIAHQLKTLSRAVGRATKGNARLVHGRTWEEVVRETLGIVDYGRRYFEGMEVRHVAGGGYTVIDGLWKGMIVEIKTSIGAIDAGQLRQLALAAERNNHGLAFIFLENPGDEAVAALWRYVREVTEDRVSLAVNYILD
ncbi:MAG TPA: PKD domain-containing protein [Thermoanaerobaculia bacterium]